MIFLYFVFFLYIRSIPYLKSMISRQIVDPRLPYSYTLPYSVFGSSDGSSIQIKLNPMKGLISLFSMKEIPNSVSVASSENGLDIQGDYAYVTDGSILRVYNISDKANITVSGTCVLGVCGDARTAKGVSVKGNVAFVSREYSGITSINVTDKNNLKVINTETDMTFRTFRNRISGDRLFIADMGWGFVDIDISDPANMVATGETGLLGSSDKIYDVSVDLERNVVFAISSASPSTRKMIYSINVTDPTKPTEMAYFLGAYSTHFEGVYRQGNILYVADSDDTYGGFKIFDVSDPFNMALLHTLSFNGSCVFSAITMKRNYAFLGHDERGLVVYDISNFTNSNPIASKYSSIEEKMIQIVEQTNFIYFTTESKFKIFEYGDITILSDPQSKPFENYTCGNDTVYVTVDDDSGNLTVSFTLEFINLCQAGNCSVANKSCVCETDIFGKYCDEWECHGVSKNDEGAVCSGHGTCVEPDNCVCNAFHYGENCNITSCGGLWNNDSSVSSLICNNRGICETHNNCSCYLHVQDPVLPYCVCPPKTFGLSCLSFDCYGMKSNEEGVCSGYGNCTDVNVCNCESHYFGKNCNITECNDILSNETHLVCNQGRGICDLDTRKCLNCSRFNHSGDYCDNWKCFGEWKDDTPEVCSHHGTCVSNNNCSCSSQYVGQECNIFECFQKSVTDVNNVCGGHGICTDHNRCLCKLGYSASLEDDTNGVYGECVRWYCESNLNNDPNVCNSHGTCIASHTCQCEPGYHGLYGNNCNGWSCGVDRTSSLTCNGNGVCEGPNECDCKSGYSGDLCGTNTLYASVMAPILTLVGIGGVVFFVVFVVCTLCCCFCFFVCFLCLGGCFFFACFCMFFCFAMTSLCGIVVWLFGSVKKFGRLKNFDLLLKEQEMDDDTSIAHLKINKGLFEIPFEEIKTTSVLGEGGSSSTVFKANWGRKVVAFKCFKTRALCSSQNSFDEFEREVEVMANLSHPNVIRFFGATMKPPRVGIVMEFCENGELIPFFEAYREQYEDGYSVEEKIRMCLEIVGSMEYLHSRSIIHRDLKSENVLVDSEHHCKLMDFGLSRVLDRMSVKKTTRIGTNVYMAPEIVGTGNYDLKCDVFSFAILMWVMFTENTHPYGNKDFNVELRVSNDPNFRPKEQDVRDCLPKKYFVWVIELIQKCWSHKPEDRFNFTEIDVYIAKKMRQMGKVIKMDPDAAKVKSTPRGDFLKDSEILEDVDTGKEEECEVLVNEISELHYLEKEKMLETFRKFGRSGESFDVKRFVSELRKFGKK